MEGEREGLLIDGLADGGSLVATVGWCGDRTRVDGSVDEEEDPLNDDGVF